MNTYYGWYMFKKLAQEVEGYTEAADYLDSHPSSQFNTDAFLYNSWQTVMSPREAAAQVIQDFEEVFQRDAEEAMVEHFEDQDTQEVKEFA